jgi:hypothetical protein
LAFANAILNNYFATTEFPSASTAICSVHARTIRLLTKSDHLRWKLLFVKGQSWVDPGNVPHKDLEYEIKTW